MPRSAAESHAGSTYAFISAAKTGHRHAVIKQTAPIHFITYIELFIGGVISRSSFDTDVTHYNRKPGLDIKIEFALYLLTR